MQTNPQGRAETLVEAHEKSDLAAKGIFVFFAFFFLAAVVVHSVVAWHLNGLSKSQCLGGMHCCRPAIAALEQHCDGNALEAMSGKLYQTRSNMGLGVPFAEDLSV